MIYSIDLQYNRIIRKKQVQKKGQGCMSVNDLPKLIKEYGKDITFIRITKVGKACKTQQKSAFPAFFCEIQEKINL